MRRSEVGGVNGQSSQLFPLLVYFKLWKGRDDFVYSQFNTKNISSEIP